MFPYRSVMTRRTTPKKITDEAAYPIRIKVLIPPLGLSSLPAIHKWLIQHVGRDRCAQHGASIRGWDAVAFYFLDIEDAAAFLRAFPALELDRGPQVIAGRSG